MIFRLELNPRASRTLGTFYAVLSGRVPLRLKSSVRKAGFRRFAEMGWIGLFTANRRTDDEWPLLDQGKMLHMWSAPPAWPAALRRLRP